MRHDLLPIWEGEGGFFKQTVGGNFPGLSDVLGEEGKTNEQLVKASKPFINALCDQPEENYMTTARFKIFTMKKNTPKVQSLPPTEPNLHYHILRILRVHLQIMLWEAANCKAPPDDSYDITQNDWVIKDGIPVP
ncbi:hypothetical protein DPMN_085416 [Dreissena polymorpha]|uniref:Uncharacterized protein n=1 Tax=Dreissena polymorpha TaxID=45954 RepID=A0A9D3YG25_DREPO|nr:hypothetical protein DPMN_085416 [Dreissena polymorpha]